MKILCVEDGSVDVDKLEEEGLKDGSILVYRQGAKPPFVLEVDMPTKQENIIKNINLARNKIKGYSKYEHDPFFCGFTDGVFDSLIRKIKEGE